MRLTAFFILLATGIMLSATPLSAADTKETNQNDIVKYSPPETGFWETVRNFFLPHYEKRNVISRKESEFFLITVEDDESGRRHLVFHPNRGSQGIILPEHPDRIIPNFLKYSFLSFPVLENSPRKILFIGLGAGIMPRFINRHYPECRIDIVEIDKAIPPIAEKYFGFRQTGNINVEIEDGRFYVNRSKKKYDIIVVDAYNAENIPFQLTTVEFFRKVKGMLNDKGILVANIANFGKMNFIKSEFRTVAEVFPYSAAVVCPGKTNYVLFASAEPYFTQKRWLKQCGEFDEKHQWHFKLAPFLETRIPDEKLDEMRKDAKVLKDAFAPVNQMD